MDDTILINLHLGYIPSGKTKFLAIIDRANLLLVSLFKCPKFERFIVFRIPIMVLSFFSRQKRTLRILKVLGTIFWRCLFGNRFFKRYSIKMSQTLSFQVYPFEMKFDKSSKKTKELMI